MALNPPRRNVAWSTRISLNSMTVAGAVQNTPTLATGDVKVDTDGAGLNNIGTLPTVSPSGGPLVLVSLTASEMNGDIVSIVFRDQTSPKEWEDRVLVINTTA